MTKPRTRTYSQLILALGLSLFSHLCAACSCLWQGSFADVQAGTDLVISGEIIAIKGNSADLWIEQTLRGKEFQNPVRIWMHTGATGEENLCRPNIENFPTGSRWVLALNKITEDIPGGFNPNTPNISYGRIGDYSLSSCGGYWLQLTENVVSGSLSEGPRWDMSPKMTPVLLNVVTAFVQGKIDRQALIAAAEEDTTAKELMLDTKSFLRDQN